MSSPTRKRRERGDESIEDSDWAIEPSPRQQHPDSSGDYANSEGYRSATSKLWKVLHDPTTFPDEDDIDFQPEAFLAAIEDVLCNNKDGVDYRVRIAARSILSSRIFDLFKELFTTRHEEYDPVDELCLLNRINSLRLDMSRGQNDGPIYGLRLIDGIISDTLFTMWEPGKDWLVDKLCQIERIVAFILDKINVEEDDETYYLCLTKQIVSFIGEIISHKDAQVDKLDLIWRIGFLINHPIDEEDYFILEAEVMTKITDYLKEGLISKKDDPVYGLHLIDQTISFFLNVKRDEKDGQADKVCLIERTMSFIDDIIGEKDDQVDKFCQIKEIVNLCQCIYEFDSTGLLDKLILMGEILIILEMMIKGEKNDQVDKLHLTKQIISFLKADYLEVDKLEVMHHIVSWTETKLLWHGSSRSEDEAFEGELEARNRETELLTEAPTHNTVRDTLRGYTGRSKFMQHFTKKEGNKWLCKLCGKDDPPKKKTVERNNSGTTTPFIRHLKKFHIEEYNKIRNAEK